VQFCSPFGGETHGLGEYKIGTLPATEYLDTTLTDGSEGLVRCWLLALLLRPRLFNSFTDGSQSQQLFRDVAGYRSVREPYKDAVLTIFFCV
jgi:hypothetical protein